ncbi:MAG: hypothetical protein KU37_03760 [Sulfuricurvum sp. PC08-66]|nr:MAG: hypothetical protein KU37_03760 [Sulfuricurvum sp. PC08-66]
MYRLIVALGLAGLLQGMTLEEIITHAKAHNPALKAQTLTRDKSTLALRTATLWSDPTLSIGLNDIPVDDPLNRGAEPMQTQTLSLTQALPAWGLLEAQKALASLNQRRTSHEYASQELQLIRQIKQTAVTLWKMESLLALTQSYSTIIDQRIALDASSASQNASHAAMMRSQLTLYNLKRSQIALHNRIAPLLAELKAYANMEISSLQLSLPAPVMIPKPTLSDNPELQKSATLTQSAQAKRALAQAQAQMQPFVQASYNQRQNFSDYLSVALGAKIPLYGAQEDAIEQSTLDIAIAQANQTSLSNSQQAQLERYYSAMQEHAQNYAVLVQESLPTLQHMIELAGASIKNSDSLMQYLLLLEQQFTLNQERIEHMAQFYIEKASLEALLNKEL